MILLGILLLAFLASMYAFKRGSVDMGGFCACVFGLLLFLTCMTIPIIRLSQREKLVELQAFKDTLLAARLNFNATREERAAIFMKISEWNCWIASEKYWLDSTWSWWHLEEVRHLEPLS